MQHIALGMQAIDLVEFVFVYKCILFLEVVKYQCEEKPHFAEAKRLNPKAKRTVAKALQHTPDFTEPTLFIQHNKELNRLRWELKNLREIDSNEVAVTSYIPAEDNRIRVHEALKVISRVKTKEGIFHIPLLDMDLPINEASPTEAEEVARSLGIPHGVILDSGKSYHLWGLELLAEEEWRKFMYRALLLDRVDSRWIGHRLLDGQANLRISEKRGKAPTVIHVF